MLRRDARQKRGIVAADLEDSATIEHWADSAVEELSPRAAMLILPAVAEDEVVECEKPVGVDASAAADGHFTTSLANARARSIASGSLAGSFPPACAICGRPPPPPPATLAVSRIQSPALSPSAIRSSETAAQNDTFVPS